MYPLLWVGVMTYELPLSVDGSDKTNQIGPFQQVAKTTIDGNKMTTDWTAHVANGENKAEGAVQGTVDPDRIGRRQRDDLACHSQIIRRKKSGPRPFTSAGNNRKTINRIQSLRDPAPDEVSADPGLNTRRAPSRATK